MNEKFKLVLEYLKYQGIVKGRFDDNEDTRNLVFTDTEFDNIVQSLSEVSTDLNNAVKSLKNNKNQTNEDVDKKIRFYETQSKFFSNLFFGLVLLKIIDLYLLNNLSKDKFIHLTGGVEHNKSIFYYNLSFLLFRKLYEEESNDTSKFVRLMVDELLNIDILNVCTHFNEDYFKIDYFDDSFYGFNFSLFLSGDFSNVDSRYLIYFRNKKVQERYSTFIKEIKLDIIVLQVYVMIMLKRLLVGYQGKYERKVAHYTNYNVAKLLITNTTSLRLNSTDYMNDPTEGKIFLRFIHLNEVEYDAHNKIFLTCFTFNHNNLNQFRLYGLNENIPCTGISLVYSLGFFFSFSSVVEDYLLDSGRIEEGLKFPLFRCIYMDPFTGYFEVAKRNKFTFYQEFQDKEESGSAWGAYLNEMDIVTEEVNESINNIIRTLEIMKAGNHDLKVDDLKASNKIMKPISYLVKHFSFQEEQECRMIVMEKIESEYVVMDENDSTRSYVEYGQPSHRDIKNIYIGLASSNKMVEILKTIKSENKKVPKTMVSDNPYRV